ncbi:MAG: ABC transporter ATP-binding protein [Nitrospiraceae bacterium]|nr:MAG: ABC transporter ATP-binding protein [Nitrospiraceae bacterium]
MSITRKIINLTKPYWSGVFIGIILGLMFSGINAAIAWAVKPALDEIFTNRKYEYLTLLPFAVFGLFILKGALNFGQNFLMKTAGLKLVRDMRNKLYNHILALPVGYFNKESSGVIISRIMYDAEVLRGLMSDILKAFVLEVPTILFLLGLAFYRRWDLTLMTLALLPLIAYSTRKFGKSVKKKRKEAQRKLSFLTQKVGESILGVRIIKVFNREKTKADNFTRENQRYYRELLRVERFKEFTRLAIEMVTGLGIALILWYGGHMVINGTITPGDFASIIVAIYMIFSPTKKIGEAYTALQEIRASIERVDTLLDAKKEESGKTIIKHFKDSIKFNNVSFAYAGRNSTVLKDVNLEIHQGEVIAIVGQSGVGKSTLVDLIPGFLKSTKGEITIDGININDLDLRSLRELTGIVSQDIILFNDTIRENIAFGREGAAESEIVEAAKMSFADDFIQELPEKYETVIGERGLQLSGGQRQRIAIARAILKNPPILILDEATSSLDSVSEAIVQKALETLMSGRTTIVIAHRLSTVRNAGRIIILDKGRISDIGTHEQLMARNDTYMKLYHAFAHS